MLAFYDILLPASLATRLFEESVTEAASATDTVAGLATYPDSVTETATATEFVGVIDFITEACSATDTPSCVLIRVGALTERGGAREEVLNAIITLTASAIVEAATASDVVSLPVWTDNADDDQSWLTNTNADSAWTNNSHAESTWTEN